MFRRGGLIGLGSWEGEPFRQGIFTASTFPPLAGGIGQVPGCQPCPAGTYGCGPSYCYAAPSWAPGQEQKAPPVNETQPVQVTCPPGTTLMQGQCVPTVPGAVTPAEPPKPSWWSQRTDTEKWMVIGGGVLGAVALLALLRGASHAEVYSENLRARPFRRTPTGLPRVAGKRWGSPRPPARYRRLGAVRASDYAFPERFKYPLVFRGRGGKVNYERSRRHVWNAKTRFTQFKHRYPTAIRRTIASNINRAARRFGLAPDVRP